MIDKISYYVELFITLCGYDGSNNSSLFGFFIVLLSALIVIYSLYFAVSRTIWPKASDGYPEKYNILDDDLGELDAD